MRRSSVPPHTLQQTSEVSLIPYDHFLAPTLQRGSADQTLQRPVPILTGKQVKSAQFHTTMQHMVVVNKLHVAARQWHGDMHVLPTCQ